MVYFLWLLINPLCVNVCEQYQRTFRGADGHSDKPSMEDARTQRLQFHQCFTSCSMSRRRKDLSKRITTHMKKKVCFGQEITEKDSFILERLFHLIGSNNQPKENSLMIFYNLSSIHFLEYSSTGMPHCSEKCQVIKGSFMCF